MPNRMERFTQSARSSLSGAQYEATRMKHGIIAPEHIILALLADGNSICARALRGHGINEQALRQWVESRSYETSSSHIDLSDGTKRLLERAVDAARQGDETMIRDGHLLLGLLRLHNEDAVNWLVENKIDLAALASTVQTLLRFESEDDETSPTGPGILDIADYLLAFHIEHEGEIQFRLELKELADIINEALHQAHTGKLGEVWSGSSDGVRIRVTAHKKGKHS